MHLKNIARLHAFPTQAQGMDIIIVSTESRQQEEYWEARLRAGRGLIIKPDARVCCVKEEWTGGAGNGLGSLHAFSRAREKMLARDNVDIAQSLEQGAAIAIYHTAGMGKRLFPLTASEYCNKAAVKLPSLVGGRFLSILEAVIKQTGVFAPVRKGRVSVFWGDQVFIPSMPIETRSKAHIDILAVVNKMPTEEVWHARKLDNYGLIVVDGKGQAKDVEKCQYSTVKRLLASGRIAVDGGAGLSIGSFSLSGDMLFALLDEFCPELKEKSRKMDSDPYIWMPLTLDLDTYLEVMDDKEASPEFLKEHYKRMQNFKMRFTKVFGDNIFGVVNVGGDTFWWDYGTVQSYLRNNLKLCNNDLEAQAMKAFFKLDNPVASTRIRLSRIHNSVVVGVSADQLRVSDCVILNSDINAFEGSRSLLYNVVEDQPLHYPAGSVRADILMPATAGHIKMVTNESRDGKADWKELLPGNPCTYEELYEQAHTVDPLAAEKFTAKYHHTL